MSYSTIKEKLLEEGKLFEDENFPAQKSSLFFDKEDDSIEWKRPHVSTLTLLYLNSVP